MATVIEILELSGVPTLCASKATKEESQLRVGEVIAKALQVHYLCVYVQATPSIGLHQLMIALCTRGHAHMQGRCNHAIMRPDHASLGLS